MTKRKDYITVNEAAKIKGCSRQSIHAAIQAQRLVAVTETAIVWKVCPKSLAQLVINPKRQRAGRPRKR